MAKGFKLLTIFVKCSKLDVCQGSQYTSGMAILFELCFSKLVLIFLY